jgi:hypothetical protein
VNRNYHEGMQKSEAIQHFGSASKLAKALGLKSRQAIYQWPDEVPELYQYKLHHLTRGKLPLSPDLKAAKQ